MKKIIQILILSFLIIQPNIFSKTIIGKMYELNSKNSIENGLIFLTKDSLVYDVRVTDETGNYCFGNVKLDSFSIKTMRYGYVDIEAGPFTFDQPDTFLLFIELDVTPISMQSVLTVAERIDPQLESVGFYQRKEESSGYFYTREDIEECSIHHISDIFNRIPGLIISKNGVDIRLSSIRYLNSSIQTNHIPINIYLDGVKVDMELDMAIGRLGMNFLDPGNIKAIEVYPSSARAPAIYGGMAAAGGVILIWTGR